MSEAAGFDNVQDRYNYFGGFDFRPYEDNRESSSSSQSRLLDQSQHQSQQFSQISSHQQIYNMIQNQSQNESNILSLNNHPLSQGNQIPNQSLPSDQRSAAQPSQGNPSSHLPASKKSMTKYLSSNQNSIISIGQASGKGGPNRDEIMVVEFTQENQMMVPRQASYPISIGSD